MENISQYWWNFSRRLDSRLTVPFHISGNQRQVPTSCPSPWAAPEPGTTTHSVAKHLCLVLFYSGCYNKTLPTEQLINNRIYFSLSMDQEAQDQGTRRFWRLVFTHKRQTFRPQHLWSCVQGWWPNASRERLWGQHQGKSWAAGLICGRRPTGEICPAVLGFAFQRSKEDKDGLGI